MSLPELGAQLQEHRPELELATLARVRGIPAGPVADAEYLDGLRAAVGAALAYVIAAVEQPRARPQPVPPQLPAQARLAARNGVPLETVLRRYFAGHALLADYAIELTGSAGLTLPGADLQRFWRAQSGAVDRMVAAASVDYRAEAESRGRRDAAQERLELVRRLLRGELTDASALGYDYRGWNTAAVASGPDAVALFRHLADACAARLLLVRPGGETVWAWFGGERRVEARALACAATALSGMETAVALGECGRGVEGWRLTHRQARSAHAVAARAGSRVVCHAEVALLATALQDELLASTLTGTYLAPLTDPDGGLLLCETLRCYFAAGRNVSSAAASLGVSRQTVSHRLQAAEQRLGRTLASCAAELETALRLEQLAGLRTVHSSGQFAVETQRLTAEV